VNAMPVQAPGPSQLTPEGDAPLVLEAFSNIASSVFVVSTVRDGRRHGRTATSVAVIAVRPAEIMVSIAKGGGMVKDIVEAGAFSLSLLASDQSQTADIFAGRGGLDGEDRFAPDDWDRWPSGNPFLKGAVINLDCRVSTHFDTDRNRLFLGRVRGLDIGEGAPLVYQRRAYRKLVASGEA
jgi:flavin reductase (DIM6/NTAB) family NADH-FMN oxidoreductase RutF